MIRVPKAPKVIVIDTIPLLLFLIDKEHFEKWFEKLNQINEICYILILLKFPNLKSEDKRSSFYFPKRMEKLKKLLNVG